MLLRPSSWEGIPNTFLRKKRKWPHSPYKTKWHYIFNQQQAMQTLKRSSSIDEQQQIKTLNPNNNTPYLLNCLIDSFNSYQCDPTPTAYQFVIKTLTRKSQFTELNHVLSHLQSCEKFDTPERIFVDLIRIYGENGMVREAIDLFFRIPKFRCVPTAFSLNSLLSIVCRNRELLRIVPQLVLKSRAMNIRLDELSFSILINALCGIRKVGFAIKLLNYMIDDGFNPNGKLYSFILSSLCQQESVGCFEVMGIFEDMRRVGFCPTRADFRNVIKLLVKRGKGKDAFDVLCDTKREGIKPDLSCYTMVLDGLVEEGEFSRVEELFDEILVFGFVPDVRTYNAYINGLCKQKKADEAYQMLRCMGELGCRPDSVTYKTLLEAFCEVEELSRARELWKEMKLKGVQSNSQMYQTMVDALFVGGEVLEACDLLEEMLSKDFALLPSNIDHLICCLCKGRLASEAICALQKVCAHNVAPGSKGWEALILGLNLNLEHEKAMLANLPE